MTRSRNNAPAEEPEEDTAVQEEPAGNSTSLTFNEKLSWPAGKPIPTTTLHTRLKKLAAELQELEQEDVDRESLATAAKELVSANLISHKDDGVRAFTACCLADMLRLHAPDAPYTAQQLRDIFSLFVSCLKGLADPEMPYYSQYIWLLESLSTVKSIVLISDIPDAEQIALSLFTTFFDVAKPEGAKQIEYHMTDILTLYIDECNNLPTEVVDIIVAQFLRNVPKECLTHKRGARIEPKPADDKQTKLVSAVPPPAYNMAKNICNTCVDKMARHICQYFSEVIMDSAPGSRKAARAGTGEEGEEERAPEPAHADLQDLHRAHVLAKELWKACPAVLQNVIPLLEQELLAENSDLRELSTETIGEMVITGTSSFAQQAPATWKVWMGRVNDKSPAVRAKWVEAAVKILKNRNDQVAVQLVDLIAIKLNDLDERVRLAACQSLKTLDYQSITTKLAADNSPFNTYDSSANNSVAATARKSKSADDNKNWGKRILQTLAERVRDKKIHVRLEGMRCLAKMWDMAYKDLCSGNEVVFQQLGWIPSKILDTFYINDPEVNVLLDHVLHEILIPVNYPPIEKERYPVEKDGEKANGAKGKRAEAAAEKEREKEQLEGDKIRVQRLLVLVKGLDTKAKRALFAVPLRQISYAKVMEVFLKACEEYNGGVIPEKYDAKTVNTTLDKFSSWLSQKLPEPPKAKENLLKFAKLHDRRCYHLIRCCFNPESDYRTVVKALKEIKKRMADSASPGILDALTPLLYRVSQLIYNKSHVAPIVEFSRTDELGLGGTAHEVLKEMSASNPAVFKANVKALSDLLQEQSPDSAKDGMDTVGAVDTLKACAGFAKSYPKDMPQERKLLQVLVAFALTGKPPAAAKHAVTILMHSSSRKEMYATDLIKRCVDGFVYGGEHFLAKLACIGQLVLLAPQQCEEAIPKINDIAKDILLNVRTPVADDDDDEEWVDDSHLDDEIQAKILALRILVNMLRHSEVKDVQRTSVMVMDILLKTVRNAGSIAKESTPKHHRSRLRLVAAQLLLKLAVQKTYEDIITPQNFHKLACVAQDSCYGVRRGFIDKLKKYLASGKLPPRYYTIVFLMAYEPVVEWKEETTNWIRSRTTLLASKPGNIMEVVFARLLSLLVHHPDFGVLVKDLSDFSNVRAWFCRYILFYLRAVSSADNISLIYHIAQRLKQQRDRLSPENSENLYYVSELAQAVIRHYAAAQKWTLNAWPGVQALPAALFMPIQSGEESRRVTARTFLPADVESSLGGLINPKKHAAAPTTAAKRKPDPAAADPPADPPAPKKQKAEKKTPKKQQSRKQKIGAEKTQEAPAAERRRSGRITASAKKSYRVDGPSDEEDFAESEEDEVMIDADSEDEDVVEPVRRRGRARRGAGGGEMEVDAKEEEEKEEKEKEEGEGEGEKEEEEEQETKKQKTLRTTPAKRATRNTRARKAREGDESSELSDVPSE